MANYAFLYPIIENNYLMSLKFIYRDDMPRELLDRL